MRGEGGGSDAITTMHYSNITSLFKYRTINQDTLEALRKQKIWVASPSSFNDPFDTNTDNYVEELSPETIETFEEPWISANQEY